MTALDAAPAPEQPRRRRAIPPLALELGILVVVAVVLFLVPYVVGTYVLQIGYLVLQLAALGTAWNLLAGYTGMVSLGSAAFVGIGIYAMAQLDKVAGAPWFVGFLAGGLLAAAFAAIVSPAMFRLRGLYFTIGTLALAEALRLWMVNSPTFGGASDIFLRSRAPQTYELYWMMLGAAVLATAVVLVVARRPVALRLNAIRDDEDVAKQMGVFTFRTKLWAFTIAAFLMGVVGSIQALNAGVVEPYGSFGLSWTVDIVMVVIIGGLATRTGPWIGALLAVLLEESLKGYAELHLAITGVILLLVIRFAPRGIWGTLSGCRAPAGAGPGRRAVSEASAAGTAYPAGETGAGNAPVLSVRGLTRRFGGVTAVSELDLDIPAGEVLGVIGPNGAGKSTLVGLVCGALAPSDGSVALDGVDVTARDAAQRARAGVGRTHQIPRPFARMSVLENLLLASSNVPSGRSAGERRRDALEILDRTGLAEVAAKPAVAAVYLGTAASEHGTGTASAAAEEQVEAQQDQAAANLGQIVISDSTVASLVSVPETDRERPLLAVSGLAVSYGGLRALRGMDFAVHPGETVTLLCANGAGKTTFTRAVAGALPLVSGTIRFAGQDITGKRPDRVTALGLAQCMEGRRIFGTLTVEENLVLGAGPADAALRKDRLDAVYSVFPILAERRGHSGTAMSGGQQQMLAIGRALMSAPRLLVLDEISLGLAPIAVDRLYEALEAIKASGVAMILVEQNIARGLSLAERAYVLAQGQVALTGTAAEVRDDPALAALYVGEAHEG